MRKTFIVEQYQDIVEFENALNNNNKKGYFISSWQECSTPNGDGYLFVAVFFGDEDAVKRLADLAVKAEKRARLTYE